MKRALVILVAVCATLVAAGFLRYKQRAAREAEQRAAWELAKAERAAELQGSNPKPNNSPLPLTVRDWPSPRDKTSQPSVSTGPESTAPPSAVTNAPAGGPVSATQAVPGTGKKRTLQDPLARVALSFAGVDPEAEEVWAEAINNPDLPPKEREDLIEDLNEEGFPDPKNITPEDLPLILNRLALIEEHWPDAMDEVNWKAFAEAYKDLVNMLAKLSP